MNVIVYRSDQGTTCSPESLQSYRTIIYSHKQYALHHYSKSRLDAHVHEALLHIHNFSVRIILDNKILTGVSEPFCCVCGIAPTAPQVC